MRSADRSKSMQPMPAKPRGSAAYKSTAHRNLSLPDSVPYKSTAHRNRSEAYNRSVAAMAKKQFSNQQSGANRKRGFDTMMLRHGDHANLSTRMKRGESKRMRLEAGHHTNKWSTTGTQDVVIL